MKRLLRRTLRVLCRVPVRGRHRSADLLGRLLAPPGIELLRLGAIDFPVDHSIGVYRRIYYGLYEEQNLAVIRRLVRPGETCIDIGANVGYITSVLAGLVGPTGHVYAFEPAPRCVEILRFLAKVSQVEVVPAAVTHRSGVVTFHETDRILSMGYGYVSDVRQASNSTAHEVDGWALDDFCVDRGIDRVRFLKIDVEGAESLVLQGAQRLLAERRVDYVLTELSGQEDERVRTRDDDVRRLLGAAGYVELTQAGRDVMWRRPEP
jgi:FkbM family methyltransferase